MRNKIGRAHLILLWSGEQGKSEGFDICDQPIILLKNWIHIINFSVHVTLKFDEWHRKTIGHLFCTTSSFVHHFKSIGGFKLQLQSRNAQFGSKLAIFCPVWPWNLMDDLDNTAPLLHLCYFKHCKSFQSHRWVQTGVTVRKHSISLKISDICPLWPWHFTDDLEKQQGTSPMLLQDLSIIS